MAPSLSRSGPPHGFRYLPDWLTAEEEQDLLRQVGTLSFSDVRMHGVTARRKVVHFGWDYGYESWRISRTDLVPAWLRPLQDRVARLIQTSAAALEEVLVTRYDPGAGIGWHRDAPMFGPTVVGVSLAGPCRMRFQRKERGTKEQAEILLDRRSAYILSGAARWQWQHSIPPTKALRYSITFRTVIKQQSRSRRDDVIRDGG
ncbi:MAG TPA: alpha-ketoglutarate-dependent dioxygenase AlkB [Nitrospira sp.]|nr:alpha-ketoglutarate-dependent dioxygenase AlkB [Nitrospira sp.]